MSHTKPNRKYSEEELGLIIKRAAELQQSSDSPTATAGLELGEIQQLAGEMGLDSHHIVTAAAELEWAEPPPVRQTWWRNVFTTAAPQSLDYERTLANGTLSAEKAEALVEAIHTALPLARGRVQQTDRQLKLSSRSKLVSMKLHVYTNAPSGHPTHLKLSAKWWGAAFFFRLPFFLSLPLVLGLDPATFDATIRTILTAIIPVLCWLLTGIGYSAWANKQWERINLLNKRMQAILTEGDQSPDR